MNKIEKLIAEYCPDGVEFKKLGECASTKRGKRVTKSELNPEKKYPVYKWRSNAYHGYTLKNTISPATL